MRQTQLFLQEIFADGFAFLFVGHRDQLSITALQSDAAIAYNFVHDAFISISIINADIR